MHWRDALKEVEEYRVSPDTNPPLLPGYAFEDNLCSLFRLHSQYFVGQGDGFFFGGVKFSTVFETPVVGDVGFYAAGVDAGCNNARAFQFACQDSVKPRTANFDVL